MIFGKKQTLVMIKRVEFGIYLAETGSGRYGGGRSDRCVFI